MDPAANQRISPNRVVLILALLLGVWLAFQFYPRRKPAPPLPPVMAESKLRAVGLPDNVDLEGLPEFFALVAAKAEWKEGRTRFAYWHPVMKTYSYYFEARRESTGFRFREITEPHDPDHDWDGPDGAEPIRFYRSDFPKSGPLLPDRMPVEHTGVGSSPKVNVDIPAPKILPPEGNTFPVKPEKSQ